MKKITSKDGSKIKFRVDGATSLTISDKPINVDDGHAVTLKERLGGQVIIEDSDGSSVEDVDTNEDEEKDENKVDTSIDEDEEKV